MSKGTVLISGVGVAGPTLAYWLRAGGFAPTLVEQAPSLRSGGYVIDFWGLGYDIAERMVLREEIDRVGYHIQEMRIVNARGARIAGLNTRALEELTGGRYVTLPRSELSRLLVKKIGSGAEIIFGDEICGLDDRADGVEVQLKHAGKRRFDLVIGADGLHSRARSLIFGPQEHFEKRLGYLVAAFEAKDYRPRDENAYVVYSDPGRMVGRVALREGRTLFLLVFTIADQTIPVPDDLPSQREMLRNRFGGTQWELAQVLDALKGADDLYFDRVSQIRMPSWSRGRVALVGDAAHCVSLVAGQGSALAMTAAYVLAGELTQASGYTEAFANYERILRSFIDAKQQAAERFASAFAPKTRWGLFLRNQILKAAAIPGLARITLGRDIVDRLRLPDYAWKHVAC